MCQAHTALSQATVPDQAELDMDSGCDEPDLCFSRSQVRDPAYALLDSGATHVLLPGHMLPKGARSFEVTVNLAVGKEKAKCWRNEVYAQERAHPLLPIGQTNQSIGYEVCMGEWDSSYAMQRQRQMANDDSIRDKEQHGICKSNAV